MSAETIKLVVEDRVVVVGSGATAPSIRVAGTSLTGPQGPAGPAGADGAAGAAGETGPQGEQGPAGVVATIVAGTGVSVDSTDPANPIVSASLGSSGVDSVNGATGVVVLDADDIDDTSTTQKFTTAAEASKLAGIEAAADVTDTTNVTAAGALMDSEVSSLSGIKSLTVPDSTTISTFGATLVDDTSASAARTTLGAAATSHGHVIADVTGLQTTLDGKQAADAMLDDLSALSDPGADRVMFWDDSAGELAWLTVGTGLAITGTQIDATGGGGGGIGSVVEDTTPQLGGDLDVQSFDVGDATAADLTKLHAVTASATEINVVDGITATTTELNYTDGVTSAIQTQIDGKAASSHTHTIANVTSLQTTLDGKASSTHTHATSDITSLAEFIRDTIATALTAGTNITITPNDGADTITIEASGGGGGITTEDAVDAVAAALVAGGNIDITYNDAGNTITIAVESLTTADITDITASAAELNFVDGVTSAIQTQLDGKSATGHDHAGTYQPLDSDLTDLASKWAAASASGGASLLFHEDTDNGTNRLRLVAQATQNGDFDLFLPQISSSDQLVARDMAQTVSNKSFEATGSLEYNVNIVAASGSTESLNLTFFNVHDVTMDQACTFTFSSPAPSGDATVFILILRGAFTPTFPASVDWGDATPPTYTTPSVYGFITRDAGTTWLGVSLGKAFG